MESSRGLAPEGFKTVIRANPKPSEDGVIHGDSPITVEYDACGSTVEPGKTAHFLYDFEFDHVPDVVGTGDACAQKHTYRIPKDATGAVVIETNVCVTNGDPNVHDGSTYFSCRTYRIGLPEPKAPCQSPDGVAPGCYLVEGIYIDWPGGAGPYKAVEGFESPGCNEDSIGFSPFAPVLACSLDEAMSRCEGPAFDLGVDLEGRSLYACGEPGPALAGGTATGGWRKH
jgi:hypothetical protein